MGQWNDMGILDNPDFHLFCEINEWHLSLYEYNLGGYYGEIRWNVFGCFWMENSVQGKRWRRRKKYMLVLYSNILLKFATTSPQTCHFFSSAHHPKPFSQLGEIWGSKARDPWFLSMVVSEVMGPLKIIHSRCFQYTKSLKITTPMT